jgi:hypothetical protein
MNDPTTTTIVSRDPGKQFFGHPRGLVTCFMVEFFERFTYYGMRSMLVLFLSAATLAANPGFGVDGATAGAVYALFTGGAYLLAIPGAGSPTGSSASEKRYSSGACSSRPATSSLRSRRRSRCSTRVCSSWCLASGC